MSTRSPTAAPIKTAAPFARIQRRLGFHVVGRSRSCLVAAACVALCCARGSSSPTPTPPANTAATPLDRLVHEVCDKRIVLLGEDANHGGGATLTLKTTLVTRLVDECRFSAVVFEASLPEFVDVERAFAAGEGSRARIADAIGGSWSVAGESDALIEALFERASRKQVVLAGLDGQLSSTSSYVQTRLPDELAGYLAEPSRSSCRGELQRYTAWNYDDATPFDERVRTRLVECLTQIETTAAEEAAEMATALRSAIEANDRSARDKAMYQALHWHVAHLPPNSKIVVWCATVHAAKNLSAVPDFAGFTPLGVYVRRDFGDDAVAIGVSALAGSFGRPHKASMELVEAPADSLEARAFAGDGSGDVRYLGRADLVRYGHARARALDYNKLIGASWSGIIDGLIVLREEHTPAFIHDPKPRSEVP
jgi:erythromycin esterase-like protein